MDDSLIYIMFIMFLFTIAQRWCS